MKKVTAKEAYKIMGELGLCYGDDGRTFYAYDEIEREIYDFENKNERDEFVEKYNGFSDIKVDGVEHPTMWDALTSIKWNK